MIVMQALQNARSFRTQALLPGADPGPDLLLKLLGLQKLVKMFGLQPASIGSPVRLGRDHLLQGFLLLLLQAFELLLDAGLSLVQGKIESRA